MKPMEDFELRRLAMDILDGRVYTDSHIPENETHALGRVFMPLMFMDADAKAKFLEEKPGMIYECLTEAGPRSCNGMPCFFSMKYTGIEDAKKVWAYYREFKEAKEKALKGNAT